MNGDINSSRHRDFSSNTTQETDCNLTPDKGGKGLAHFQKQADSFTKECLKPSLNTSDSQEAYISDSEIG